MSRRCFFKENYQGKTVYNVVSDDSFLDYRLRIRLVIVRTTSLKRRKRNGLVGHLNEKVLLTKDYESGFGLIATIKMSNVNRITIHFKTNGLVLDLSIELGRVCDFVTTQRLRINVRLTILSYVLIKTRSCGVTTHLSFGLKRRPFRGI